MWCCARYVVPGISGTAGYNAVSCQHYAEISVSPQLERFFYYYCCICEGIYTFRWIFQVCVLDLAINGGRVGATAGNHRLCTFMPVFNSRSTPTYHPRRIPLTAGALHLKADRFVIFFDAWYQMIAATYALQYMQWVSKEEQ